MKRDELLKAVNDFLEIDLFDDFGPNGLQVEGKEEVHKIVTGVTASEELIARAADENCDLLIVHHGILWKGQNEVVKGSFKKRLKLLLDNNINLAAYHLPLDRHPEVGNNAILAAKIGLLHRTGFAGYKGQNIGIKGELHHEMELDDLIKLLEELLNRKTLVFPFGKRTVKSVGIVSGGGQNFLNEAVEEKLDLFITGEVSEQTYHLAKEEKINFIAAGHHATELFGIDTLGKWIAQKFGLNVRFIEIHNPV